MSPDPLQIALEHHRAGRFTRAQSGYREILHDRPGDPDANHWLGVLTFQAGDAAGAVPLIERAVAARPDDAAFQFNLGQALLASGRAHEAARPLQRSTEIEPTRGESWMALGVALLARKGAGDANAAVAALRRARDTGLDSGELHDHLAVALLAAGDTAGAIVAGLTAITREPNRAAAYVHLAAAYRARGDDVEARRHLSRATELDPQSAPAWNGLGVLDAQAGRLDEACEAFRKALAARPAYAAARRALVRVLRHMGRADEANRVEADGASAPQPRAAASASPIAELEKKLTHSGAAEMHYTLAAVANVFPPTRVPAKAVTELFDRYAEGFDQHLQGKLNYHVPERIADAVSRVRARDPSSPEKLDILDLGCGTGLCGPPLREIARSLHGVDLSPAMVEKTKARGVYDRVEVGDLVEFMRNAPGAYDLLVAADVFIYVGDINPAFEAAATCLRAGGMLAFSAEAGEGDRYQFRTKSRRFAHSREYLRRLAGIHGFAEELCEEIAVRNERGRPLAGYLVVLRSPQA